MQGVGVNSLSEGECHKILDGVTTNPRQEVNKSHLGRRPGWGKTSEIFQETYTGDTRAVNLQDMGRVDHCFAASDSGDGLWREFLSDSSDSAVPTRPLLPVFVAWISEPPMHPPI